jgi:hypothetical protein
MNIRFLKLIWLLGGLLALAIAGHAQSPSATVHVPFRFVAGGKMLPAGEYTISDANISRVLLIRGSAGNSLAVMTTAIGAGTKTGKAKLSFERRGSELYLSSIEMPDQSVGLSLPPQTDNATLSRASDSPTLHH